MTFTTVAAPRAYVGSPRRGPLTRLLEDERWLAMLLLLPTVVLLGLFIAYPFFKGIMLSVTDTRVGVPRHFVGLQNFVNVWHDSIFRVAVWNTCVYTFVATVFQLALGFGLAVLLNNNFKGKAITRAFILLPFIIPTVLSTLAWKWMFDPTFSVITGGSGRGLSARGARGARLEGDRDLAIRRGGGPDQRPAVGSRDRGARGLSA